MAAARIALAAHALHHRVGIDRLVARDMEIAVAIEIGQQLGAVQLGAVVADEGVALLRVHALDAIEAGAELEDGARAMRVDGGLDVVARRERHRDCPGRPRRQATHEHRRRPFHGAQINAPAAATASGPARRIAPYTDILS